MYKLHIKSTCSCEEDTRDQKFDGTIALYNTECSKTLRKYFMCTLWNS